MASEGTVRVSKLGANVAEIRQLAIPYLVMSLDSPLLPFGVGLPRTPWFDIACPIATSAPVSFAKQLLFCMNE